MPKLSMAAVAASALLAAVGAQAQTIQPETLQTLAFTPSADQPMLIEDSDGCRPHGWRGERGHCHHAHGPYGYNWHSGCPSGYWKGPWGHCRDTPYHGRLPNGGWK